MNRSTDIKCGRRPKWRAFCVFVAGLVAAVTVLSSTAEMTSAAQVLPLPKISIGVDTAQTPDDVAVGLQLLLLLTVLALAPSILVMMTSFTRIVVVLGFVRNALGTQQMPPTQVIVGLSLFLTAFVMAPTWQQVNDQGLQPYLQGKITFDEAVDRSVKPVREFMFAQTREKDLALFVNLTKLPPPKDKDDIPTYVLIPAFAISELRTAFEMGFLIFIPFIVIDMIVASTLMSMGMLMLPPVMISLPFKILLFVLVDGWNLVAQSLVQSFR